MITHIAVLHPSSQCHEITHIILSLICHYNPYRILNTSIGSIKKKYYILLHTTHSYNTQYYILFLSLTIVRNSSLVILLNSFLVVWDGCWNKIVEL